jgi:hypothetical protein
MLQDQNRQLALDKVSESVQRDLNSGKKQFHSIIISRGAMRVDEY